MPYVSSLSTHGDLGVAVAETIGQVLDKIGASPDFAVVFMSGHFKNRLSEIHTAMRELLAPKTLMGCTSSAVVCGANEIEDRSALAVFAGNLDGEISSVRLSDPPSISANPIFAVHGNTAHTMLLLADPLSFPTEQMIKQLHSEHPHIQVIGGLISSTAADRFGSLFLDGEIHHDGAVALLIGGNVEVKSLVSQGCRPIGAPLIVTKASGNLVHELGGQPALKRLEDIVAAMEDSERLMASHGLHIGRVIDEHKAEFSSGDFLIRAVLGADRDSGVVAIGDAAPVGSTIQFQVRDAHTATDELDLQTSQISNGDGALLFTCNGRGTNLFEDPNHDASRLAETVTGEVLAGMFCAGEIGPVATQTFLHGFTVSAAIFRD